MAYARVAVTFVLVPLVALVAAGCGDKSFDVKVEAGDVKDGVDAQQLWVGVTSSPKANIVCKPHCGEYRADGTGRAVFPIKLDKEGGTHTFEISATEAGLFGKSKSTTLTFEHKANVIVKNEGETTTIRCGVEKCEGTIPWQKEGALLLGGSSLARVELGTAAREVDGAVRVPIGEALGGMPLARLTAHAQAISVDLPLKLTFKSGAVVTGQVRADVPPFVLSRGFGGVKTKPVLYSGEDAGDARLKAIFFFGSQSSEVVGPAATFREVDAIAFEELDKREIKCGKYSAGKLGTLDVLLDVVDVDVEVYQRRTSKLIAKKRFVASTGCPSSYTTENGAAGRFLASTVPPARVTEWLRAQLKTR